VAKTITFRIIATTLDLTTNYLVIGELGAAVNRCGEVVPTPGGDLMARSGLTARQEQGGKSKPARLVP
jgi:hypothetical protein